MCGGVCGLDWEVSAKYHSLLLYRGHQCNRFVQWNEGCPGIIVIVMCTHTVM